MQYITTFPISTRWVKGEDVIIKVQSFHIISFFFSGQVFKEEVVMEEFSF